MREIALPAAPIRKVAQSAEERTDWYENHQMETSAESVREYAETVRDATEGKYGEFASVPAPAVSWLVSDAYPADVSQEIDCCTHYLKQYNWWE